MISIVMISIVIIIGSNQVEATGQVIAVSSRTATITCTGCRAPETARSPTAR